MSKIRKCFSIDEEDAGQIVRVASQMGLSESDILSKYLQGGLKGENELTSAERFHYKRNCIMKSLDSVLRIQGIIMPEASLGDKYRVSLYVAQGKARAKKREFRREMIELSLFEILTMIKDMDIDLFKELVTVMSMFGEMKKRYFNLYKK